MECGEESIGFVEMYHPTGKETRGEGQVAVYGMEHKRLSFDVKLSERRANFESSRYSSCYFR